MSTSIREQFFEIQGRLYRAGTPPVRVSFSLEGYQRAMKENVDNTHFVGSASETYMGLPFSVRSEQIGEIGLHTEFEKLPGTVTLKLGFDPLSGRTIVDGKPYGEPINVLQIIGAKLSAGELCDIIQAWLESDCQKWGEFEKRLHALILEHGTFE